jgi:hypothetical protein
MASTTNLRGARSVSWLGSAALHSEPERVRPLLLLLRLKLLGLRAESKGVGPRLLLLLVGGGVQVPALRAVLAAAGAIQNPALHAIHRNEIVRR